MVDTIEKDTKVQAIRDVLDVRRAIETMRNIGLITSEDYDAWLKDLNDKSHRAVNDYLGKTV